MSLLRLLNSTLGRKILMGLTGLLLIGFLVIHLSGNLLVFRGPESFNHYSETLLSNPLIYVAELILLGLFVLHFTLGILLTKNNYEARPTRYQEKRWAGHASHKTISSTTMIVTGVIVLLFVPLHIWTFKYGPYYTTTTTPHMRDLYRLVIEVFQRPLSVAWYVVAMILVGFHLWHGFGSAFESLGVRYNKSLRWVGQVIAVVLAGGFLLIPVLIFFTGGAR